MTARSILESRLGRSLGPVACMPRDTRKALYNLALQLVKQSKSVQNLVAR